MQAFFISIFTFLESDMEYSLLIQKMSESASVKDSFEDFGMVCTDVPLIVGEETKELPSRDWPDEDGEDVFVPDALQLAAYDWKIEMCYKGDRDTCYTKMKAFRDYLTGRDGSGALMKVYSPYTKEGRQNVYLKKIETDDFWRSNVDEVSTFTLTLRVTDPATDVQLAK